MIVTNVKKPKSDIIIHDIGNGYNIAPGATVDLLKVFAKEEIEISNGLRTAINEGWIKVVGANIFEEPKITVTKKIKDATKKVKVITDVPAPVLEIKDTVTPEIIPEATPEITPEVIPEATPEVIPEATIEVTPEATIPEVTIPEAIPEATPENPTIPKETSVDLEDLDWAEVRKLAKEHNINARQKKDKIIEELKLKIYKES